MDYYKPLLTLSYPWAHLSPCTEATFERFLEVVRHSGSGIVLVMIRGGQCRTSPDFFREVVERLQFPGYFGHNWDAFNDCINDLEWLPAQHYVIAFSQSDSLLADDETRLATFADILGDAADAWPSYEADRDWTKTWVTAADGTTEWGQRPVASFHVVFHCEPENEAATRDRFERVRLSLEPLHIPPSLPGR